MLLKGSDSEFVIQAQNHFVGVVGKRVGGVLYEGDAWLSGRAQPWGRPVSQKDRGSRSHRFRFGP